MKTPIVDFVRTYAEKKSVRLHMPGHKGKSFIGCESLDITEISGADVIYSADGIINESENNATQLFGTAHTFYSTEGSSHAIKAMLALATAGEDTPTLLATRNAHKAFVYACALLDISVEWVYGAQGAHLCTCDVTPAQIESALCKLAQKPAAVYVTSPDYLGHVLDIQGIADVCHKNGVPLLVDNAHGAYLAFLERTLHPIALGADMCCDSAHKTLPVLTGGAYLHISKRANPEYISSARERLALFASTSPSYLTLQSLDTCNAYLDKDYSERLKNTCKAVSGLKDKLSRMGYEVCISEPLKVVLSAKNGTSALDIAAHLSAYNIEVEFADNDFLVMMLTPENSTEDIEAVESVLAYFVPTDRKDKRTPPSVLPGERVMSIRSAVLSRSEQIPVRLAEGKICASPAVSCPPAVPVVVAGERITGAHIKAFEYYGIENVSVVK